MVEIEIPGVGTYTLTALVTDMNGTLTLDGKPIDGVQERLKALSQALEIHMVTADTFGTGAVVAEKLGLHLHRLVPDGTEALQKARLVRSLGADSVVAMGNGSNDVAMLREAAIGIAVLGPEGSATEALLASDIVAPSILLALDLLLNPKRLAASLRH